MHISVEQLNGETLVLEVTPETTMREVKRQIKDMHWWEDDLSRDTTFVEVIVGNKKLGNDETVAGAGLSEDSVVTGLLRQNIARCSSKDGIGEIDPETLVIVEIPDSEVEIGRRAFRDCRAVAKVSIPSSVRRIGMSAFAGCSALRHVTIPNSVTQVENNAFEDCSSLTSVTIPDSVTQLEDYTFCGCASLTSITIPDSVTHIHNFAFKDCASFRSVTIADCVRWIASYAFEGCSQLTLTAPASLLRPKVAGQIKVAKECGRAPHIGHAACGYSSGPSPWYGNASRQRQIL